MNSKVRSVYLLLVAVVYSYIIPTYLPQSVSRADIGCSVSVSPSSIRGGATSATTFTIQSFEGSDEITSARISTTAVDEFQIQSAQATGWTSNITDTNSVNFDGGTITAGSSQAFSVSLAAIDQDQSTIAWEVYVNGDIVCTGSPGVAIYKSSSTTGATLYNVGTTSITTSEATISWTTSTASSSQLEYGTSSSYGLTKSSSTLTSTHSFTLTGLSAGTTYHFKVSSVDADDNQVSSSDYTFSTSGSGSTTTTVITPTSAPTQTPTPTPIPDRTKPTITLKTDLSKPVKVAPKIEGDVADNKGVAKIEYSVDGGNNWIEVKDVVGKDANKKTFSFTPPRDLDDGNYTVVARATDLAGNKGESKRLTMVIDRLDPQVGPHLFHIGPLLLEPQENGDTLIPSDTTTSLTFSAVGGPTSIVVKVGDQIVQAKKHLYSGLWKASFKFENAGRYEVIATATDGAGNVVSRSLGFVTVQKKGKVESKTSPPEITVYVKQPELIDFVLWDGEPYGIANPMKTVNDGSYSLILPPGTYYIHISAFGSIPSNTTIFTVTQPTVITQSFTLEQLQGLRIGPFVLNFWDLWKTNSVQANFQTQRQLTHIKSTLLNKPFPNFSLPYENRQVTELAVRGNATVLSVLSSWSPFTQLQLAESEKVKQSKASMISLFPHESVTSVLLNKKKGEYRITFVADKDGELLGKLDLQTIPTHYFIDRQGIVRDVVVGVLSADEITNNLIY